MTILSMNSVYLAPYAEAAWLAMSARYAVRRSLRESDFGPTVLLVVEDGQPLLVRTTATGESLFMELEDDDWRTALPM